MKRSTLLALMVVMLVSAWTHASGTSKGVAKRFYLCPGAESSGDGAKERPFNSFDAAKQAVRAAVADNRLRDGLIEVVVLDGRYEIMEPVSFGAKDSGSKSHPVRWRSQTRGGATLTGGVKLPKLRKFSNSDAKAAPLIPASLRNCVMVVDLAENGITDYGTLKTYLDDDDDPEGMELVWNGKPMQLARWPNGLFVSVAPAPWYGNWQKQCDAQPWRTNTFAFAEKRIMRWRNEQEPFLNGFFSQNWLCARLAVDKINASKRTITVKGEGPNFGMSSDGFYYAYNLMGELDAPGEYYIDRTAGKLYFFPPEDSLATADGELTVGSEILKLEDVSNVVFAGFVLENCRGTAVTMLRAKDVSFLAMKVRNAGIIGFKLKPNCERVRIDGCDISYCGADCVRTQWCCNPFNLENSGIVIENCDIHHFGRLHLGGQGVRFFGCGSVVDHCTIHDGPTNGVSFDGPEHKVTNCEIHSVALDCGDEAAVYTWGYWTMAGSEITGNYIHDIYYPKNLKNIGIMLDDGCAGICVRSNVVERVPQAVIVSAVGNRLEDNIFMETELAVGTGFTFLTAESFKESCGGMVFETFKKFPIHKEPWASRYKYVAMIDDSIKTGKLRDKATRTTIKRNFSAAKQFISFWCNDKQCTSDAWVLEDNHENCSRKQAQTLAGDIKRNAGVYASPLRASWPVEHPVTKRCDRLTGHKCEKLLFNAGN